MIDINALFKVSYGLYIVTAGNSESANGFISNTVFQVTAEPPRFAACCNKNNYTSEFIEQHGYFTCSVLSQNTSSDIFGHFGYKTGRNFNKMEGMQLKYGLSGTPVVLNDAIAFLECKVINKVDVGTHWIFIAELIDAEVLSQDVEQMTYDYYRKIRRGVAPKNAPTYVDKSKAEAEVKTEEVKNEVASASAKKYKCAVCGHVYDEQKNNTTFSDLSEQWKCPDCGADKEDFIEI